MKQLLFYISLVIFLTACSENTGDASSSDTTTVIPSITDTLHSKNILSANDYYGSNDSYYEALNKEGTQTIVTSETPIFEDSLLLGRSELSLFVGEEITIEKSCGTITRGNWAEPVYKISYKTGEDIFYGYLSQSSIACIQDTLKSNKIVLLSLDYNNTSDKFTGNIFLMDQSRKILSTSQILFDIYKEGKSPYSFYYYFSIGEIEENLGLEGIHESFYISAGYDACGYPHITNIFLWNDKKLLLAPETYSVSDAGVFYANGQLYFPADSLGRPGYVVQIFEVVEQIDGPEHPENNVEYYNKDSTVILYKWNNTNYTFSKADTVLSTSRKYSYQTSDY